MNHFLASIANPSPKTPAEQAQAVADQITAAGCRIVVQTAQQRLQMYNALWNTPGVPVENIVAALGTEAESVFASDAALCQVLGTQLAAAGMPADRIAQMLPGVPPSRTATPNPDGTMTIGLKGV